MAAISPESYRKRYGPALAGLAADGVFIGTSSWKYDGWRGIVYGEEEPGKKGEDSYLKQYARLFPTVCADFTFYRYYEAGIFRGLYNATPPAFSFALKVTQSVLIDRYPSWFKGENAGKDNKEFLDADVFVNRFLDPTRALKEKLGPIIFEFGEKTTSLEPASFVQALDAFFSKAPTGLLYAVEVRRKSYLSDDYFASLKRHGVAHVINSQQSAPPMREQIEKYPVFTASHSVIRALTPPRVSYKKSVEIAEPFDRIVIEYPDGVAALAQIVRDCREAGRKLHAYINNRLEGCGPLSIAKLLDQLGGKGE